MTSPTCKRFSPNEIETFIFPRYFDYSHKTIISFLTMSLHSASLETSFYTTTMQHFSNPTEQNASRRSDILNSCKKYLASCGIRQYVKVERHATCPCPEPRKFNPRPTSVSLRSVAYRGGFEGFKPPRPKLQIFDKVEPD